MQRPVKPPPSGIDGSNPSQPTRNSKQRGAIGVGRAVAYYSAQGYAEFVPVADVSRYDLLVDTGDRILRVEVKTTAARSGEVDLRTRGGNQSWHGSSVYLSSRHCDVVFAVNLTTGVEREYSIEELEGRTSVTLPAL